MKVLVTGAEGFIGQNLTEWLRTGELRLVTEVIEFTRETDQSQLDELCLSCDFVVHLAGVNRPDDDAEFQAVNTGLTQRLLGVLRERNAGCPVLLSSSAQAELDNAYGRSKKAAEDEVIKYSDDTGAPVFVYRLPGVFGKWSRPNYNTVVATLCHNTARDLPISIDDPAKALTLAYIDDVVAEFGRALEGNASRVDRYFCAVSVTHSVTLGEMAELLADFRSGRHSLAVPNTRDAFASKLYATYLSFLPPNEFSYPLITSADARGSFTEIIRTDERGQFSVNVIRPGITKGDHWHNTKNEKFLVVAGDGIIRFRDVRGREVIEYRVSGEKMEVVDIPPGYTHNIGNTGTTDMVTFMWSSECFDAERPDTYPLPVRQDGL
ncbi:SDR family oxidoreductase [bacterium]|nr:SDR family oxidoreductase [bacterium]